MTFNDLVMSVLELQLGSMPRFMALMLTQIVLSDFLDTNKGREGKAVQTWLHP